MIVSLLALMMTVSSKAQDNTSAVGTLDLTLERAIEIALAENPTIKIADKEVELKKVADKEAWQALLPEVTAQASLSHTLLAAEMKLNTGNGVQKFKMGRDDTNTAAASATLSLPLFAPAVYQNMKLTKQDILLAQEKARGSRLDLIQQVTKAYYAALLAQDSYKVMEESYNISKQNYDVVNAKFEHGTVSEYDKISSEVQMRNMNSNLVSARTGLTLSELQLKVLMGVTENVNISINDKLENYEQALVLPEVGGVDELMNNSAMRQFDLNRSILERSLKLQRTNFMPTVGFQLTGQYQSLYNTDWNVFGYEYAPSASFAIAISIPLFKASNWTGLKKTKLQISELEDQRDNTLRQLNMAAESYRQNMASSIAQVSSNREAVRQADKAVNISQKRYEVGRGTILEVNQSQVALTQTKLTYSQSIYDYLTNRADLDYTLGRDNYLK